MNIIKIVAFEILMSDSEDPDFYIDCAINAWKETERSQWLAKNSTQPLYRECLRSHESYAYTYQIIAHLTQHDFLLYKLKYD